MSLSSKTASTSELEIWLLCIVWGVVCVAVTKGKYYTIFKILPSAKYYMVVNLESKTNWLAVNWFGRVVRVVSDRGYNWGHLRLFNFYSNWVFHIEIRNQFVRNHLNSLEILSGTSTFKILLEFVFLFFF